MAREREGFRARRTLMPALHVEHRAQENELRISTEPKVDLSWVMPWDGTERMLTEWLELVAEEIWGDYCDPSYKYWVPPGA